MQLTSSPVIEEYAELLYKKLRCFVCKSDWGDYGL